MLVHDESALSSRFGAGDGAGNDGDVPDARAAEPYDAVLDRLGSSGARTPISTPRPARYAACCRLVPFDDVGLAGSLNPGVAIALTERSGRADPSRSRTSYEVSLHESPSIP